MTDDLLLPPGTRLVHIGPQKTGTTALQGALMLARPQLARHGVVYPGRWRQHALAARALTGAPGPRGHSRGSMRDWRSLVREVTAAGDDRVIVSAEAFSMADLSTATTVVDGLGGDRVHVLVTLRPLSAIMPSAWQQYVRAGLSVSYRRWLRGMLSEAPYDRPTPSFWQRHHHDLLVERWASIVGPERVTVLALDGSDPGLLTRTVERLAGLPAGLLKPEPGRTNRSLTYPEIELVRALNAEARRQGWSDEQHRRYVQDGMILRLQTQRDPQPGEPKLVLPEWALQRAAEIGAAAAARISALGVRVVGDLSALGSAEPAVGATGTESVTDVPLSLATEALVGSIAAGVAPTTVGERLRSGDLTVGARARIVHRTRTSGALRRLRRRPAGGQGE